MTRDDLIAFGQARHGEHWIGPLAAEINYSFSQLWRVAAPHRYSLCWAPIETYHPKTAEQLATARARREERAVEREAEANPLFADQIREEGIRNREQKGRSLS